jgi:hypothetical protein
MVGGIYGQSEAAHCNFVLLDGPAFQRRGVVAGPGEPAEGWPVRCRLFIELDTETLAGSRRTTPGRLTVMGAWCRCCLAKPVPDGVRIKPTGETRCKKIKTPEDRTGGEPA